MDLSSDIPDWRVYGPNGARPKLAVESTAALDTPVMLWVRPDVKTWIAEADLNSESPGGDFFRVRSITTA